MPRTTRTREAKRRINLLEGESGRAAGKSATAGLQPGWTRRTFIVRDQHLEKLEALSYWEKKSLKELIDDALDSYLSGKRIKAMRSL